MMLDQETINFGAKAIIVVGVMCAGIVAPTAGIVIFSKVAVRLSSPMIEEQLLKSQSFLDRVAMVAEHKALNSQAKLLGAYEVMIEKFKIVEKLANDFASIREDIAVLKDRSEQHK